LLGFPPAAENLKPTNCVMVALPGPLFSKRGVNGDIEQSIYNFLIRLSTSGFMPDTTSRVIQELVAPKYRATSAPE
jgi:hypothetical protein